MRSKAFSPHHFALPPSLLCFSRQAPPTSCRVQRHRAAVFMRLRVAVDPRPPICRRIRRGLLPNDSRQRPPSGPDVTSLSSAFTSQCLPTSPRRLRPPLWPPTNELFRSDRRRHGEATPVSPSLSPFPKWVPYLVVSL
jgi:hypothetical protein